MHSQLSLGWWVFCFYTLRTYKVIHLISKEAQLLIYNADNDAGHPLSGISPSFCWEQCSSTKWLGIKKGIHVFQGFCQQAIPGKKRVFWSPPPAPRGRLNSEGIFTVVKFCSSKWNQVYPRLMPWVNLLTENFIPRDIFLHMVLLLFRL